MKASPNKFMVSCAKVKSEADLKPMRVPYRIIEEDKDSERVTSGSEVRGMRLEVRKPREDESSQSAYAGQSPSTASTTSWRQFRFAGVRSVAGD